MLWPYLSLPSSSGMKNISKSSKFHAVESCYDSKSAFLLITWQQIAFIFRRILLHRLWPVSLWDIFRSYLISVYIYEKLSLNTSGILFSPKHSSQNSRIQWKSQRDMVIRHGGLHVKSPSFLYACKQTCIFYTDSHTIPQHKISRKSVRRELTSSLLTVEQTDRHTCRN